MIRADLHLHSKYSDGKSSLDEIVKKALSEGFDLIALTDHVRKDSKWVGDYINEIIQLQKLYKDKIKILIGVEVKALNQNGDLDIDKKHIKSLDLILGSVHRIPINKNEASSISIDKVWYKTTLGLINNEIVDIVAHPLAKVTSGEVKITKEKFKTLLRKFEQKNKYFEINQRYPLDKKYLDILYKSNVKLSFGSDRHSVTEDILDWDLVEKNQFMEVS